MKFLLLPLEPVEIYNIFQAKASLEFIFFSGAHFLNRWVGLSREIPKLRVVLSTPNLPLRVCSVRKIA